MADQQQQAFEAFLARHTRLGSWETTDDPRSMRELVATWIAYWKTRSQAAKDDWEWSTICVDNLVTDVPNLALDFVLITLSKVLDDPRLMGLLAAGPLDDLIAQHGPELIGVVEEQARQSPRFRDLLRGVWQNRTSDDIWQRVLKAAQIRP